MRQRWLGLDATVGGFIYSKSAGEPLKDSAQSSQLMELLFLKTQWLMCGEQVNRHRSRKVSEKLFQLIQAEREGAWSRLPKEGTVRNIHMLDIFESKKTQVLLKGSLYGMRGRTRSSVTSRFLT